jgi:hypothetical protein
MTVLDSDVSPSDEPVYALTDQPQRRADVVPGATTQIALKGDAIWQLQTPVQDALVRWVDTDHVIIAARRCNPGEANAWLFNRSGALECAAALGSHIAEIAVIGTRIAVSYSDLGIEGRDPLARGAITVFDLQLRPQWNLAEAIPEMRALDVHAMVPIDDRRVGFSMYGSMGELASSTLVVDVVDGTLGPERLWGPARCIAYDDASDRWFLMRRIGAGAFDAVVTGAEMTIVPSFAVSPAARGIAHGRVLSVENNLTTVSRLTFSDEA